MSNATTGRDWVRSSHHEFYLTPELVWPHGSVRRGRNGLVSSRDGFVRISTGIHTGGVDVTVEVCGEEPPADLAPWEDVGEASVQVDTGRLYVTPSETYASEIFPNLTPSGVGSYRVRVHARGRMLDFDGSETRSREQYLVQVWPAPPSEDTSLRITDAYAAQTGMTGTIGPAPATSPPPVRALPTPQPQQHRPPPSGWPEVRSTSSATSREDN